MKCAPQKGIESLRSSTQGRKRDFRRILTGGSVITLTDGCFQDESNLEVLAQARKLIVFMAAIIGLYVEGRTANSASYAVEKQGLVGGVNTILPVRPHKPDQPSQQRNSDDGIKLVEVLSKREPVLAQFHAEPRQSQAPRP